MCIGKEEAMAREDVVMEVGQISLCSWMERTKVKVKLHNPEYLLIPPTNKYSIIKRLDVLSPGPGIKDEEDRCDSSSPCGLQLSGEHGN